MNYVSHYYPPSHENVAEWGQQLQNHIAVTQVLMPIMLICFIFQTAI